MSGSPASSPRPRRLGAGLDRQDRMDAEAAAVAGTGGAGAAERGDPLAHAEQAVAAAVAPGPGSVARRRCRAR